MTDKLKRIRILRPFRGYQGGEEIEKRAELADRYVAYGHAEHVEHAGGEEVEKPAEIADGAVGEGHVVHVEHVEHVEHVPTRAPSRRRARDADAAEESDGGKS